MVLGRQSFVFGDSDFIGASNTPIDTRIRRRISRVVFSVELGVADFLDVRFVLVLRHHFSFKV